MANLSAPGQSPKQKKQNWPPPLGVLGKRAEVLLRSIPKQKNLNGLLTGFTYDSTDQEDPGYRDPSRYLFCHKNRAYRGGTKGMIPRCRLLDKHFNDPDISGEVEDIFLPPNWVRPPQPQSHEDYKVQAIGELIKILNWWVAEKVDPEDFEHPVFWFYAYADGACMRRLTAVVNYISNLITELNWSNPATAAEIKQLWDNLCEKAKEWDSLTRTLIREQQCWIDLRRPHLKFGYNPIEVKQAAAALLYKLRLIGSLIKEKRTGKASAAESTQVPPRRTTPKRYRLAHESHEWACKKQPNLLERGRYSDALYKYVKENWPGYGDDSVKCPPKETWARYVRAYANQTTGPKNTPRQGRDGRSIVRQDEV